MNTKEIISKLTDSQKERLLREAIDFAMMNDRLVQIHVLASKDLCSDTNAKNAVRSLFTIPLGLKIEKTTNRDHYLLYQANVYPAIGINF